MWLADLTHTSGPVVSSEAMPQAVGLLATFAAHHCDLLAPPRLFKYPAALAAALDEGPPGVLGLSNYVWNSNLAYQVATLVKARWPEVVIVMGGPHYPLDPQRQQAYLTARPAVDFYIEKEGEVPFVDLLGALEATGWDVRDVPSIPGVHRIGHEEHDAGAAPRVNDIASVPSPYLAGLLDEFFDGRLVPTLTTNRGCPFSCTFCIEGQRYYSKVYKSAQDRVEAELHYMGELMADVLRTTQARNELLITDSNFGMFPEDEHTCEVIADCQDAYGWPLRVDVTTGKNRRDRVITSIKKARGAIQLSGAVQSLDETVLENVRRTNIDAKGLMEVAVGAAAAGAPTYSDVVLALPGDSYDRHADTLGQLIDAGFERINTFQLQMLPGSQLASAEERERHQIGSRWRVTPRCCGEYDLLGTSFRAAEFDEVGVENATMTYDDYLRARQLDLSVFIFYNSSPLPTLLRFLRSSGVPIFEWINRAADAAQSGSLVQVYEDFVATTEDASWDSEAEAKAAVAATPEEDIPVLGANLLYEFRARAVSQHWDAVVDAAHAAATTMLPDQLDVLADIVAYDRAVFSGVFDGVEGDDPSVTLSHDVLGFVASDVDEPVPLAHPVLVEFRLAPEQRDLVETYRTVFGAGPSGIGRFLSRVPLASLQRSAVVAVGSS